MKRSAVHSLMLVSVVAGLIGCQSGPRWAWWNQEKAPETRRRSQLGSTELAVGGAHAASGRRAGLTAGRFAISHESGAAGTATTLHGAAGACSQLRRRRLPMHRWRPIPATLATQRRSAVEYRARQPAPPGAIPPSTPTPDRPLSPLPAPAPFANVAGRRTVRSERLRADRIAGAHRSQRTAHRRRPLWTLRVAPRTRVTHASIRTAATSPIASDAPSDRYAAPATSRHLSGTRHPSIVMQRSSEHRQCSRGRSTPRSIPTAAAARTVCQSAATQFDAPDSAAAPYAASHLRDLATMPQSRC